MLRNCDEDSGRSSCSATSVGLSPIMHGRDSHTGDIQQVIKRYTSRSQDSDLKVSSRPRSCVFSSPDERDPFPSRKLPGDSKKVLSIFDVPRKGGLSSAHSTYDIITSTQLEHTQMQGGALSFNHIDTEDRIPLNTNFKRTKPVQRVASRLYKTDCGIKGKEGCIGPEFVVRAANPAKEMDLTLSALPEKKLITVILLNGQKVEIKCDSNTVTAGQLFEALIKSEKYEQNFMLGLATLIGGDFVFLPDDYKIKKIAPEGWHKPSKKQKYIEDTFTLFMRIKFFLPTNIAKMMQGGDWRHRVYLQLRRATVEGQLSSTIQNLILLTGYALHIEFGDFTFREHGTSDYFLLEHYLPEHVITQNMADIKLRMKRAHETRRGLDRDRAIINFISLAQTFRDYGSHFYSAIWATRDGFCRDVWLSIGPKGVTLYSRNNHISEDEQSTTNRIVLQCLPWHHIHTFYYNKKSLYLMPNSYSGLSKMGVKYKLRMADNKSYFTFWLASLHHRLYLKLYAREDFMSFLANELGSPLNLDGSPKKVDCSNYQDSYNLAVRQPLRVRRPIRRRFKVDFFGDKKAQNKDVNKENQKPTTEELLRQILSPLSDESFSNPGNSSNECMSSSESSLPRRQGVKMGTRVFNGIKTGLLSKSSKSNLSDIHRSEGDLASTQSDYDDQKTLSINSMKLLPERNYHQSMCHTATAYVLESPRVYPEPSMIANESCANMSLVEKLDNLGCVQGERVFVTAHLERNEGNALGLQVAEGSDGKVYIKSISLGGPADQCKKLLPGDQIISVNGRTLLNVKYDKALTMLQNAPKKVELIVLQNVSRNTSIDDVQCSNSTNKINYRHSIASASDVDLTDDELLNEEALKTIYALIKITKEKVLNRMKDTNRSNASNETSIQKCYSENKLYQDTNIDDVYSEENTPVRDSEKFNTWRCNLSKGKPKRRPLSLSIPSEVLPDNYLDHSEELLKQSSLKSIQSTLNSEKSKCLVKNVALPRNYAVSRKWLGPVRYPVTPCKNSVTNHDSISDVNLAKNHYNYGIDDSDDDQIFL